MVCHSPKKTQASSSQSFKILHKKMLLSSSPPSKQTKKMQQNPLPSTKFLDFFSAPSHGGALIFFGVGMAWAFTVVSSAKAAAIAAPTPKSGSSGTKDSAVGSSGTKEPKPGRASKIETSATAWVFCSKGDLWGGLFFCEISFRLSGHLGWLLRSFLTNNFILGFWVVVVATSLTRSLSICSCLCGVSTKQCRK